MFEQTALNMLFSQIQGRQSDTELANQLNLFN
jgi:hypothetical protein